MILNLRTRLGTPGLGTPGLGTSGLGTTILGTNPRPGNPLAWGPPAWGLGTSSLPYLCNYQRPVAVSCKDFQGLLLVPHLDLPSTTGYLERDLAG